MPWLVQLRLNLFSNKFKSSPIFGQFILFFSTKAQKKFELIFWTAIRTCDAFIYLPKIYSVTFQPHTLRPRLYCCHSVRV